MFAAQGLRVHRESLRRCLRILWVEQWQKYPRVDSEKYPGERDVIASFHEGGRETIRMCFFLGEGGSRTNLDPGSHTIGFFSYFQSSSEYRVRWITESYADRIVEVCEIVIIKTQVALQPCCGQLWIHNIFHQCKIVNEAVNHSTHLEANPVKKVSDFENF